MWQMLKASAQILDRIWSHRMEPKYGKEPNGMPANQQAFFYIWMLIHLYGSPTTTCALFLSANQQS
jgi:hypothetical protein